MAIYRDDHAGLAARIEQLRGEIARRRARLADEDLLALFIEKERIDKLEALRFAAESEERPLQRADALERHLQALQAFIEHAEEVSRAISRPTSEEIAFAALRPRGGHLALPRSLEDEQTVVGNLLSAFAVSEIVFEEGAEERLFDTWHDGSGLPVSVLSTYRGTTEGHRELQLFVQARFLYQGVPLMLRQECGGEEGAGFSMGVQLRCGVPRALGDLWVRNETLADKAWHKPIKRTQDIDFHDAPFDKRFVISGDEEGARAVLDDSARKALVALHAVDHEVGLNIAGGIACLVLPNTIAGRCLDRALPLVAGLHRARVERELVFAE